VDEVTLKVQNDGAEVNGKHYAALDATQFVRNMHSVGGIKAPSEQKIEKGLKASNGTYAHNSVVIVFQQDGEEQRIPAALLSTRDRSSFNSAIEKLRRDYVAAMRQKQEAKAAAGTWYQMVCDKCGRSGFKYDSPSVIKQMECVSPGCGGLRREQPCEPPGF
jgi:hypothetical protein